MTITVKQHYRNVNGKLVLVHEGHREGEAKHETHDTPHFHQNQDVEGSFDHLFGHLDAGEHDEAAQAEPDLDAAFASLDDKLGNPSIDEMTDDAFAAFEAKIGGIPDDAVDTPAVAATSSEPTVEQLMAVGNEWKSDDGKFHRIYFNGKDFPEIPKGAKVWFDLKTNAFGTKTGFKDKTPLDAGTEIKVLNAIKAKAAEAGAPAKPVDIDAMSTDDKVAAFIPSTLSGHVMEDAQGKKWLLSSYSGYYGVTLKPASGGEVQDFDWNQIAAMKLKDTGEIIDPYGDLDAPASDVAVGSHPKWSKLQPGMVFGTPGSDTTITDIQDDTLTFKWNTSGTVGHISQDDWPDYTTWTLKGGSTGPVAGDPVSFDDAKPGMVLMLKSAYEDKDENAAKWTIEKIEGGVATVKYEGHGKTDVTQIDAGTWADQGYNGLVLAPTTGPKVGDTKVVNGVTYVLNANHRWEKVENAQAAVGGTMAEQLESLPMGVGTNINGVVVKKSKLGNYIVQKNGADGNALPKKIKDILAASQHPAYKKKKFFYVIGPDQVDHVAHALELAGGKAGTKAAPKPKPAPQPKPFIPSITDDGAMDIRNWTLLDGVKKGSNTGGLYEDASGKKWYVKFPKSEDIAKNEILASKLYQACDIDTPNLELISLNGKKGVASEWQDGLSSAGPSVGTMAGAKEGFAVDAWLANWDVAGEAFDNMLSKGGKAVRIDPGGALLFRAQGEPKPGFGNTVPELQTLVDGTNYQTAAVFKGITKQEMAASAAKVLELSDDDIRKIVDTWGPGDENMKKELADKLVARKAYLAKTFPEAAVKPKVDIQDTPNFKEWNGPGQGLSSKTWINEQNQQLAVQIHDLGVAGDLSGLENMKYQPIGYESGQPEGSIQSIGDHKSKWIVGYWKDVIEKVKNPTISYKKVKAELLSNIKTLTGKALSVVAAFPDVAKLQACKERIGRYGVMGAFGKNPMEGWAPKEVSEANKGVNVKELYDASKAAYNKLTSTQKKAIEYYTGSGYHSINNAETGEGTSGQTEHAIKGLAEASIPLPEGMVLSRKFGFSSDHAGNHKKLMDSVNSVLKDYGCISTATRPGIWSGDYQLRITCAAGVKGLYVATDPSGNGSSISHHPGEREIILPYGTKFLVRKIHPKGFTDEHGHWDGGSRGMVIDVIALPNSESEVA